MKWYDEIARIARELYEKSGRIEGHDLDNWLEAERIVMKRYNEQERAEQKQILPKKNTKPSKKKDKPVS